MVTQQDTNMSYEDMQEDAQMMVELMAEKIRKSFWMSESGDKKRYHEITGFRINKLGNFFVGTGTTVEIEANTKRVTHEVISDATIVTMDDLLECTQEAYNNAKDLAFLSFRNAFAKISSRSYLFKFEDSEGRTYDQLIPYILASKRGGFPIHFYYAPASSVFRLVHINPDDVNTKTNDDGNTSLLSFAYTTSQMTIEGRPSESSDTYRVYKFRNESEQFSSRQDFDRDTLYVISEWHYQQIFDIIND